VPYEAAADDPGSAEAAEEAAGDGADEGVEGEKAQGKKSPIAGERGAAVSGGMTNLEIRSTKFETNSKHEIQKRTRKPNRRFEI
jgi:hypothetical protein